MHARQQVSSFPNATSGHERSFRGIAMLIVTDYKKHACEIAHMQAASITSDAFRAQLDVVVHAT